MIRIILLRHGQTAWNAESGTERFRGRIDLPLDDVGRAQARAIADRLRSEPISVLYSSPLLRTRQTIAPLAEALQPAGVPLVRHDGLIDIDYGRFQGMTHSEAARVYPHDYALWRSAPGQVRFPEGESLVDVQSRLSALLDEIAAHHRDQSVVLMGHQIVNKVLICRLLGLDLDQIWRVEQGPAALNVFQEVDGAWHTVCLNDTCHLRSVMSPGVLS
jgi:probable phosphoglycerate mutase